MSAAVRKASESEVIEWATSQISHGPVADYPCRMAERHGAPAETGVALVEALIDRSVALARAGILWELYRLSKWDNDERLPYVYLILWREGENKPEVCGYWVSAATWVEEYHQWQTRTRKAKE